MEEAREPWMGPVWKMSGLLEKNMDYTTAPVYIILLGDPRTNIGLPMFIRYEESSRRMIFTAGLANAFIYMHLAATTLDYSDLPPAGQAWWFLVRGICSEGPMTYQNLAGGNQVGVRDAGIEASGVSCP